MKGDVDGFQNEEISMSQSANETNESEVRNRRNDDTQRIRTFNNYWEDVKGKTKDNGNDYVLGNSEGL